VLALDADAEAACPRLRKRRVRLFASSPVGAEDCAVAKGSVFTFEVLALDVAPRADELDTLDFAPLALDADADADDPWLRLRSLAVFLAAASSDAVIEDCAPPIRLCFAPSTAGFPGVPSVVLFVPPVDPRLPPPPFTILEELDEDSSDVELELSPKRESKIEPELVNDPGLLEDEKEQT